MEISDRAKILEVLDEGQRLVRTLLKENDRLRTREAELAEANAALQGRLAKAQAQEQRRAAEEDHRRKIDQLKREKMDLESRLTVVEQENREFAERYVRVEQQNSDLISLYVATSRLHSILLFGQLIDNIKEIIINLIGAEVFGIYLLEDGCSYLLLEAHEGMQPDGPYGGREKVAVGVGAVGEVAASGHTFIRNDSDQSDGEEQPVVCIPLMVDEQVIGVAAVYRLLSKKESFRAGDYELFALFGAHVATALYAARTFAMSERKRSTLEGFVELVKRSGKLETA